MKFFRPSPRKGIWLLGIWLILAGLAGFGFGFPYFAQLHGILAIVAGA